MRSPSRRTRRLIIRPLEKQDYAAWRDAYLGLLPARNAFDRGPRALELLTRAKFSEVLGSQRQHRANDKYYDLAVFRRDTGEYIGQVSAMDVLRGLARSLGLRKEGVRKRAVFLRGKWVDLVMYSATCEEFGVRWKGNATTRAR